MKFTLDSNVLVYALDEQNPAKRTIARRVVAAARERGMPLTAQSIGEFLNVVRRKQPEHYDEAIVLAESWLLLFPILVTHPPNLLSGAGLAMRRKLQFWDSVMIEVARDDRVELLLTEDMQDGADIEGVRILNPFAVQNRGVLDTLLNR